MVTLLAKTYVIPHVIAHRTNFQGDIYTVSTPEYLDTVIVAGASATCTCHQTNCPHIQSVRRHRAIQVKADARRAEYAASFDLSYGDIAC